MVKYRKIKLKDYGIPIRTLSRRLKTGDNKKAGLGTQENEKRSYVKRLANAGFSDRIFGPLPINLLRNLESSIHFLKKKRRLANICSLLILERNKDISVRQVSVARAQGMNREEVGAFLKLFEEQMVKHDLTNRPENIFNVDETGIQLINTPEKVLTATSVNNERSQ
ncbi:jg13430 [Pararge aegeria aegeria]|uniref:Jg13430 protein n=1 Tax=Pararge aegeria aegeria TaxID=348720 RepID=A0A8S4S4T0_9NEOP|nr:jg13430 [Pararge aegeria aegeria]